MHTKLTQKGQATIPRDVRRFLGAKTGSEIEWHIVRGMVVVDTTRKIKDPVKFLTTQTKLNLNMVDIVKEIREER